jgi:hypothetical protein
VGDDKYDQAEVEEVFNSRKSQMKFLALSVGERMKKA